MKGTGIDGDNNNVMVVGGWLGVEDDDVQGGRMDSIEVEDDDGG